MYKRIMLIALVGAVLIGLPGMFQAVSQSAQSTLDEVLAAGVVRIGTRFENPPASYINKAGQWVDFDIDLGNEIARRLGVEVERVRVDGTTRITFLEQDKIDLAVASMNHTRQRDDLIDFSVTYFWDGQSLMGLKDSGIDSVDQITVMAAVEGSSAIPNIQAYCQSRGLTTPEIKQFRNQADVTAWIEDAGFPIPFILKVKAGAGNAASGDGRTVDSDGTLQSRRADGLTPKAEPCRSRQVVDTDGTPQSRGADGKTPPSENRQPIKVVVADDTLQSQRADSCRGEKFFAPTESCRPQKFYRSDFILALFGLEGKFCLYCVKPLGRRQYQCCSRTCVSRYDQWDEQTVNITLPVSGHAALKLFRCALIHGMVPQGLGGMLLKDRVEIYHMRYASEVLIKHPKFWDGRELEEG